VEGSFNDVKRQAFTGQDVRFTAKGDVLYAIALAWPEGSLTIRSLGTASPHARGRVREVRLLGFEGPLPWTQGERGLTITLPDHRPCDHAFAFRITGLTR
jgi:alpha-L-fucosidase